MIVNSKQTKLNNMIHIKVKDLIELINSLSKTYNTIVILLFKIGFNKNKKIV